MVGPIVSLQYDKQGDLKPPKTINPVVSVFQCQVGAEGKAHMFQVTPLYLWRRSLSTPSNIPAAFGPKGQIQEFPIHGNKYKSPLHE